MSDSEGQELPPPSSGLFQEVSFRRLLASCEEIAGGDTKGREDLQHWQTSPIFHHYVETLQEMLADLENSERIRPHIRKLYKSHVSALSDSLKRAEVSELCRLVAQSQPHPAAPRPSAAGPHHDAQHPSGPSAAPLQRAPLVPVAVPKTLPPAPGGIAVPLRPIAVSDAAKARLSSHAKVQETLTDELADMASALKTNTLAMEAKVQERGELLDGTEAALEKSVADTKASAARATAAHRRGRMNFCFTCLVMFIIGVGFAAMYIFIRITSITGYKAVPKKVPLPSPVLPPPPHEVQPPDYGDRTEL